MSALDQFNEQKKILRSLENFAENIRDSSVSLATTSISIVGVLNRREITLDDMSAQAYINGQVIANARGLVAAAVVRCRADLENLAEAAKAEYKKLFEEDYDGSK